MPRLCTIELEGVADEHGFAALSSRAREQLAQLGGTDHGRLIDHDHDVWR